MQRLVLHAEKDKLEEQSVDPEWMLSPLAVYDECEMTLEKDMVDASYTVEQKASSCKSVLTPTPVMSIVGTSTH